MRILLCIIFFQIGCSEPILDAEENKYVKGLDLAVRHYTCSDVKTYLTKSILTKYSKDLQLYSLENGFDSTQLRVWINGNIILDSLNHLYIISKFKSNDWKLVNVKYAYPIIGGRFNIDNKIDFISVNKNYSNYHPEVKRLISELPFDSIFLKRCNSLVKQIRARDWIDITIEYAYDMHYFLYCFSFPIGSIEGGTNEDVQMMENFLKNLNVIFKDQYITKITSMRGG